MLLRELSKHLARIVSINFLRPSAYGYLVHATIHLAIDFLTRSRSAPSHEKGQQAMLLRAFDRMPKREGEVEQV